jgi:hypothetical protein
MSDKPLINATSNAEKTKVTANPQPKKVDIVAPKSIAEPMEMIDEDAGEVFFQGGVKEDTDVGLIDVERNVHGLKEKAEALRFCEDILTINIHESSDQDAPETHVFLSVNGRGAGPNGIPWVPRGQNVKVARKYVEVLARARPSKYGSVEKINSIGEREVVYPRTSSLRYPFSVIEDPNPKGAAWLTTILRAR